MKGKGNIDDLRWVRLWSSDIVPRYLFDQIAKREYDVDELYKFLQFNCLRRDVKLPTLNQDFHIEALVNKENVIMGFLWFTIEPLTKNVMIQIYSVDNHYWGSGAVEKLVEHLKEFKKENNINKVFWITKFPKHSKKHGFKASKSVLMEYSEPEEEKDG